MFQMVEKKEIILAAEQSIAREAALGFIVARPPPIWQTMIPFMFIFDFLKRTSSVRRYSRQFMVPRRLALEASLEEMKGEEIKAANNRVLDVDLTTGQTRIMISCLKPHLCRG